MSIKVEIYQDMKGSHHLHNFQVKTCFSAPLLTTYTSINFYAITYQKVRSESQVAQAPADMIMHLAK